MEKIEYQIVTIYNDQQLLLACNAAGEDGWQLVDKTQDILDLSWQLLFMRPKIFNQNG